MQKKGLNVRQEVPFEVFFKEKVGHYFADIVIENKVISN